MEKGGCGNERGCERRGKSEEGGERVWKEARGCERRNEDVRGGMRIWDGG